MRNSCNFCSPITVFSNVPSDIGKRNFLSVRQNLSLQEDQNLNLNRYYTDKQTLEITV